MTPRWIQLCLLVTVLMSRHCLAALQVDFALTFEIGQKDFRNITKNQAEFDADFQVTMVSSPDLKDYSLTTDQVHIGQYPSELHFRDPNDPDEAGEAILLFNLTGLPDDFDSSYIVQHPAGLSSVWMNLKWKIIRFYSAHEIGRMPTTGSSNQPVLGASYTQQQMNDALPSKKGACARMGSSALSDFGFKTALKISTCEKFHNGPVAVKVPRDTRAVKWGAITSLSNNWHHRFTFVDRDGVQTEFPARLAPSWMIPKMQPSWNQTMIWNQHASQIVFSVHLSRGVIKAVIPALFIQSWVPVQFSMDTTFFGQAIQDLENDDSRSTTATTSSHPVTWRFHSAVVERTSHGIVLHRGVFSNLLRNFASDTNKTCQPDLCSQNATCSLFTSPGNPSSAIKFGWAPALNLPLDSEMVIVLPSGELYNAPIQPLYKFLSTKAVRVKSLVFSLWRGSSEGQVIFFKGSFVKKASAVSCSPAS